MYNNDENNNQNSYSQNDRPQEYYYTAGNNSSNNNEYGNFSGVYHNAYNNNTSNGTSGSGKKPKGNGGFAKKALTFVCCGALFGVSASAAFSIPAYYANATIQESLQAFEQAQAEAAKTSASLSTTANSLQTSSITNAADVSSIATSCLPSVVSITNKGVTEVRTMFGIYQQDAESSGSGIIIGENDSELLIVTNYHVVSGNNELSVVFSYDEDSENPSLVSAKLKGYDSDKDLAVISVALSDLTDEMHDQLKIATIGDSSSLQLGQEVVAIGNALGYGQSVTTGIISALNREVTVTNDNGTAITNKLIQTDAAINPGNSGGALLNMNGELVGINSVKVASSSVEGMGYAIPISDVQSIIEELMLKESRDVVNEEEQGYLGIAGNDVTAEISASYGLPVGVFINTVYDNSPAAAAGLKEGAIITKFDGQTVKSMSDLKTLLTYYRSSETVTVTAMVQSSNGYVEQNFTIALGTKEIFGEDATTQNGQDTQSGQQENDEPESEGDTDSVPYSNFLWPFMTP